MGPNRPSGRLDFKIAIICALTIEADAVEELFDVYWDDEGPPYDKVTGIAMPTLTGLPADIMWCSPIRLE